MLRISKLADYATVIMNALAKEPQQVYSAAEIAKKVHLSRPTVSKILKLLLDAKLLDSVRGPEGGYHLSRSAAEITIADVVAAIDGRPAVTECGLGSKSCGQNSVCAVRHNWQLVNQLILTVLQSITLLDMSKSLRLHPLLQKSVLQRTVSQ